MYIVCQGIFSDSIPKRDPLISIKCVAAERQNYITDQIVGVQRCKTWRSSSSTLIGTFHIGSLLFVTSLNKENIANIVENSFSFLVL